MPVLSRFYGIVIRMYFRQSEHNPPHIHAIYGEDAAAIDILTAEILDGYLPPRAYDMVKQWMLLHKEELFNVWTSQKFVHIDPLE